MLGYPPKVCLWIVPQAQTVSGVVDWKLNVTGVDRVVFFTVIPLTSTLSGIYSSIW